MASSVAKGAYYKARTRKWLEAQGYGVVEMEIVRWIFTPRGRIPIKRDQYGSDLLALDVSGNRVIFIQCKGGESGSKNISSAKREFSRFQFPASTSRWVVAWPLRSREPIVYDCSNEPQGLPDIPFPDTAVKRRSKSPPVAEALF